MKFEDYIGKHCDAYHDGKISPSRLVRLEILDVVPRGLLSNKYWNMWKKELREDYKRMMNYIDSARDSRREDVYSDCNKERRWNWNNNIFIFARIIGDKETEKEPIMFAEEMVGGSWYAVNWNYFLDIDSSLRKKYIRQWRACAKENGKTMRYNKETELFDYFDA